MIRRVSGNNSDTFLCIHIIHIVHYIIPLLFHTFHFTLTAILLACNLSLRTILRFSEYPRFADLPMHFLSHGSTINWGPNPIGPHSRPAVARAACTRALAASRALVRYRQHALPKPVVISKVRETHSTHQSLSLSFKLSRARSHFPPQFTINSNCNITILILFNKNKNFFLHYIQFLL